MQYGVKSLHHDKVISVLQVSVEVLTTFMKLNFYEHIINTFVNNGAVLVEKVDSSDVGFDLSKLRSASRSSDKIMFTRPEMKMVSSL